MMNSLRISAVGLCLLWGISAQAQNSWTHVLTPWPNTYYVLVLPTTLRLPTNGVIWVLRKYIPPGGTQSGPPYIEEESQLCATSNNGQSWNTSTVASFVNNGPAPVGTRVLDMWAVDGQNAWVVIQNTVTDVRVLVRTTNGNATTTTLPVSATPSALRLVRFFSPNAGIAVADAASAATWPLFQTTDGGTSWQPITATPPVQAGEVATDCTVFGNSIWITTSLGNIVRSTDAGQTWSIVASGLGTALHSVSFQDALHGLAYVYPQAQAAARIAVTADGGQTWAVATPAGPIRQAAISAMPGRPGVYLSVGPYQRVANIVPNDPWGTAISYDNGATWTTLENTEYHKGLAVRSTTDIWAGGFYGNGMALAHNNGMLLATQAGHPVKRGLDIYPNPTAGPVTISSALPAQRVKVYNALGQLQLQKELSAPAISVDLSGLPMGVYQVVTEGKAGSQSQRLSVVR